MHKAAFDDVNTLVSHSAGKNMSVPINLSSKAKKTIAENKEKLKSIFKTVVLCGRQNISLRGHKDDLKHIDDPKVNAGNF